MSTGYESKLSDIVYLFDVASEEDRRRVARLVQANVVKRDRAVAFLDASGAEITIAEIHRRTQADSTVQRAVYNIWMTYAH
jgi:hypothetical protein